MTTRRTTSAGARSRPARSFRPGSDALCRSAWSQRAQRLRTLLPPAPHTTLSLQLAQEALPENASQQIHAFSSTTLDDILHAFSEVSAARVVGGYLLMVGPLGTLSPTTSPTWEPPSQTALSPYS